MKLHRLAALAAVAGLALAGCDWPAWNALTVPGAKDNLDHGLPQAPKWCFLPAPTAADPDRVVKWIVDSDVLWAFQDCQRAVNGAAGIMCEFGDDDVIVCRAFGLPPAPQTRFDQAPVDEPGTLP